MTRIHPMYVHRSNRTEKLVEVLAEVVARPLGDPFARECIVVQGRGMERWLSMELARRVGIWANPDFPFPRRLIDRALRAVLEEDEAAGAAFEPEQLLWSIAKLIPEHIERPEFGPVRNFTSGDESGIRRLQLAARLADTFDHYVVYRPEMILEWERSGGSDWQAVLWRALVDTHGPTHLAARAQAFLAALRDGAPAADFPPRISLFGLSTLPPLYVRLLAALSRSVELHLFVLSPSQAYWAEIRSQVEILRTLARSGAGSSEAEQHLESGNSLLASLGRLGREFQAVLEDCADYQESADLYVDPGCGSVLETLQSDILGLRQRGTEGAPTLPLLPDDRSVAVHCCHSAMRELEVLHDQLRALFDEDPTLEPRHVIVMTPRIDAYAPFIEAVFGSRRDEQWRVPYTIADRGPRATDDVVDAFERLLDLLARRVTITDVLDLLALDAIRSRFHIEETDLELIRSWLVECGVRWGIDAEHRASFGQPAAAQNTWRFGLDRLLLGYAMPAGGRALFHGVLPYDDIEGNQAEVLGRAAELCENLFDFHRTLQEPRSLGAWHGDLGRLLETMIDGAGERGRQHRRLRGALAALAERAGAAGFSQPVDRDTVRERIAEDLRRTLPTHGFLAGGVTFCELVPMRIIPFRVVCLLGMNDGEFPRTRRPLGFDLIAQHPRPGDRSSRDDDRYLFLEALLSARQRLIITYVGQSIRDNSEIPPSPVVSELLDAVEESFHVDDPGGASALRERLIVRHPLQPFSPAYFRPGRDPRLFSYARAYCVGARTLLGPRQVAPEFVTGPLAADGGRRSEIAIEKLVSFFAEPTRAFVRERLDLVLDDEVALPPEREPMRLDGLERWTVGTRLLEHAMRGGDIETAHPLLAASGLLPLGAPGRCVFEELVSEVSELAEAARRLCAGAPLPPVEIDAEIDGMRIIGVIRQVRPVGLVQYAFSKLGRRSELGLWIRHLLLAVAGEQRSSFLVGSPVDGTTSMLVRFRPVSDPIPFLRDLLRFYRLGQEVPLPLFPRSSREYAQALRRTGDRATALHAAASVFDKSGWSEAKPEGGDPYVVLIFGDRALRDLTPHPFPGPHQAESGFTAVSEAVFGPLLDHREQV